MNETFILSVARTPQGSFMGTLASVSAPKLGAVAIEAALARAGVKGDQISEVVMGNVLQAGVGQAPARQAAIYGGVPKSVPAATINKVCGSGMKAIAMGMQSIATGESGLFLAGGMESMSNAPHLLFNARAGFRMGHQKMVDAMIHDGLWDPYNDQHMGTCAELCAKEYRFTREAQDEYAILSFKRAQAAQKDGSFQSEIAPVKITGSKGETIVSEDEGPSKGKFDKIPTLKPVFDPSGTVTAANASTINDGAAALVLGSDAAAKQAGVKPIARIRAVAGFAQEPQWFTTAPVTAMKKAAEKAGWKMSEIDLFEVNEAFAVVAMAAEKDLSIPRDRLNVWGGAISLGHPIGASGARIVVTLVSALRARGLKKGLAGICIGGGEALALAVEIV